MQTSCMAWNRRTEFVTQFIGSTICGMLNQELDQMEQLGTGADGLGEELLPTSERAEREKIRRFAAKISPAHAQEIQRLREQGERVQPVAMLDNNQLWQRSHDPADESVIARVNQSHRFYRQVVWGAQAENPALEGVLSLLLFALARGEYEYICQLGVDDIAGLLPAGVASGLSEQDCMRLVEGLMRGFRERVGATLSEMVRRMDVDAVFGESTIDE